MSEELCESLARHRRAGRTIGIKVRLDDWTTVTRAHTVGEPTNDPELVAAHALRLLAEYAPARPVRLLGVRVAGLAGADGGRDDASAPRSGDGASQLALPV
jgi:DNA polymerase-4